MFNLPSKILCTVVNVELQVSAFFKKISGATSLHMCVEELVSLGTDVRNIGSLIFCTLIQAEAD